jgi:hypothetical protein
MAPSRPCALSSTQSMAHALCHSWQLLAHALLHPSSRHRMGAGMTLRHAWRPGTPRSLTAQPRCGKAGTETSQHIHQGSCNRFVVRPSSLSGVLVTGQLSHVGTVMGHTVCGRPESWQPPHTHKTSWKIARSSLWLKLHVCLEAV